MVSALVGSSDPGHMVYVGKGFNFLNFNFLSNKDRTSVLHRLHERDHPPEVTCNKWQSGFSYPLVGKGLCLASLLPYIWETCDVTSAEIHSRCAAPEPSRTFLDASFLAFPFDLSDPVAKIQLIRAQTWKLNQELYLRARLRECVLVVVVAGTANAFCGQQCCGGF